MKSEIRNPKSEFEWLLQLLQTNDSIFPSGSYAHSFGLEGLVQSGLVTDRDSLRGLLHTQVLPLLEHVDLPFVRLAYETVSAGLETAVPPTVARVLVLDELCTALKGSAELRQAGSRIGAQRLAMLLQLAPHPLLTALDQARQAGQCQTQVAIVHGVQTALAHTPPEAALLSYFYQSLAALISAAMKLIKLGQIGAQSLLSECLRTGPDIVTGALTVSPEDIGWFNPVLDIASARHETAYTRIFIS